MFTNIKSFFFIVLRFDIVFQNVFNSNKKPNKIFLDKFLTNERDIYQRKLEEQCLATTYFSLQMNSKEVIQNILSEAKTSNKQNYSVIQQKADKICEY